MKQDKRIKEVSKIGNEILTYLVEHPNARDTQEGIAEWWLLERQIMLQTAKVKEALSDLVAKRFILEKKGSNSQIHFRVNQSKYKEIQELFKQKIG